MYKFFTACVMSLGLATTAAAQTQDTDIRPNADQLTADQIKTVFSDAKMDAHIISDVMERHNLFTAKIIILMGH